MRAVIALVLLAAVGFALAGCGAAKKRIVVGTVNHAVGANTGFGAVTVTGTATLPNVKTGTVIACRGGRPSAKVPGRGDSVSVGSGVVTVGGKVPSSTRNLQMTHLRTGWVTVSCTR